MCTWKHIYCMQRFLDTSRQTWHADVINNCKLNMFSLYKLSLVTEEYLLVNMYWKHRAALARFRCVNRKLAIERGIVLPCCYLGLICAIRNIIYSNYV